jgi:hypothetical protein
MELSRREALLGTLFGAGWIGLRSLATGLPVSFLLNPRAAVAAAASAGTAQFLILFHLGRRRPDGVQRPRHVSGRVQRDRTRWPTRRRCPATTRWTWPPRR